MRIQEAPVATETMRQWRGWKAATVERPEAWYHRLPSGCLELIDQKVRMLRRDPRPATDLFLSPAERDACARELADVSGVLEDGRGFVILEGLPAAYSGEEARVAYWLLGQALGEPCEQNVQGTLLYDVRDTGQDVRYGARFSVTSAESTFHTDNSFGDSVLDYVGLLCVQPAKAGGHSQLVSGHAVADELRRRDQAAWEMLRRPFHVDRRGGLRPGEAPTAFHPVVLWDGQEPLWRYLRYWIEVGHEKAAAPLTAEQVRSLDALDAVLTLPELRVEFTLRAGEVLFINNRWLLHNRTGFEDHPQPERRRHYVRLWLRRKSV
jgi:alpha-ketoglutarate-dependent taurine dioxygenase